VGQGWQLEMGWILTPPQVMAEWSGSAGLARAQSPILTSLSQAVSPVVEQNEIRSQGPSSKHFLRADK
jgi:hypothetical protein